MHITLLLQSIFYDRPRLLHKVKDGLKNETDVLRFIQALPVNDTFRLEAIARFNQRYQMLEVMKAHQIAWVGINDDYYPPQFHQLHDPPLGLFYRGQLMAHNMMCCGIVGSRKASVMAPYRIESMMGLISNYCIVSGGALGVDAMVHDQALLRHLPTIAILASGLDCMMPQTNRPLFNRILDSGQGCIISECPPGVRPKAYFFPQRNRLIAALSSKLIVVEAAKRSGALLTANLALGMAADVGAMVGAFNSPQSEGCYELMNDGAMVIGNGADLCCFLGIEYQTQKESASHLTEPMIQFLENLPVDPIHLDDLSHRLSMRLEKVVEYVTFLSLNGDVIISSGQMVSKRV